MEKNNQVFPYVAMIKQKGRRRVEFLGLIAIFIFLLLQLQRIYEFPSSRAINIMVCVSVSGIWIYSIRQFITHKKITLRPIYIVAFLSLIFIPPVNWFLLFFIIMALLEKLALTPEEIGFGDNEIVFSGMFKKKITWNELSNVVLKDGIISIDFKNNRLIQKETDEDEDEDEDASEEEFNAFCENRLNKA